MARKQAVYRVKRGENTKKSASDYQLPNNYTGIGRTPLSKGKVTHKKLSNTIGAKITATPRTNTSTKPKASVTYKQLSPTTAAKITAKPRNKTY